MGSFCLQTSATAGTNTAWTPPPEPSRLSGHIDISDVGEGTGLSVQKYSITGTTVLAYWYKSTNNDADVQSVYVSGSRESGRASNLPAGQV